MKTHITDLVRSASWELRRITFICHLLSTDATKNIVSAFVLSRLVYCISFLSPILFLPLFFHALSTAFLSSL